MSSPFHQSTPIKPTRPRAGVSSTPAKFRPKPPSESRYSPQSLIRSGPGTPNDDAKAVAERRRASQSKTPTKPLARFDSICQDSKAILSDMAGMFSPKKGEPETPEVSPLKIEMEVPPVVVPAKRQRGKDRHGDQRRQEQPRKKRVLNNRGRIRGAARSPADPIPGEGSSTRG
jgi:hypothetical protein